MVLRFDELLPLLTVTSGVSDGGEIEQRCVLLRCRVVCSLGGAPGGGDVACVEGVGGDEVGDVDDGAGEVMVEAVAVVEPGPSCGAELGEGFAADEVEGADEVGDAVVAAGLASGAEAAEQVGVDEEVLDLVDGDASGLCGG
ncbi:MAG: hypothetical protein IE926_08615, partial [Micrococcales bacterium]|nr:hypothetical protein [Micrococcales bacterium]